MDSSSPKFVSLGEHACIQRPSAIGTSAAKDSDPTVVLIFGWMSAELAHLHKYTAMYRQIYPETTIILVRSPLSIFWTSASNFKRRYNPVIEALEALECFDNRQRILTHSFSNGGAFHLVALAGIMPSKALKAQIPRPPSAFIIDSAPGGATLDKAMRAVTSPIRNPLVKLVASSVVVLVYFWMWTIGHILNRPNPVLAMMDTLRHPNVLPWIDERSPRLYLYSKLDAMIPPDDVEAHARRSASDGLDVRKLCFDKSAHVAHARVYPEQYWAAVKTVWEDAWNASK
ncbi:hypothetical protein DFH06DRAFT_1177614 [Mycena polygramma]|nr:hypothetical protein DFH06DRAFT_1177614 [Mycena polygramma]